MKQVTGSNTPQATNKVSIQLTLDGHSFSAHGLDGEFPGEEPVEAELLTARTMLVPEEVLGTGDAGTLLAANGMAPAAEERAVCSLPVQGIVAVMAAHREALRQAEEKLGAAFDEKAFHTFILDMGPAPFTIIRDYFDEWLKTAQKSG